jgi:hypothetical protein
MLYTLSSCILLFCHILEAIGFSPCVRELDELFVTVGIDYYLCQQNFADEDEDDEYRPVRQRIRVHEPLTSSPIAATSYHDDEVSRHLLSIPAIPAAGKWKAYEKLWQELDL